MKHGSLFSGIGGFDLGFERAGIETFWQVEIDPYCRRVLAKHFPNAKRYEDVRTVGKHNLEWVDVLSGGFPCQDISNAGKRAGMDGERSGLWSEYARIIRELRPRYVVVENVAALLNRGMERVLGDLAACGYDAEWQSIRASDVGAPHRRERVLVVAYAEQSRLERHAGDVADRAEWARPQRPTGASSLCTGESAWNVAYAKIFTKRAGLCESQSAGERGGRLIHASWWAVEPNVGRVAYGVPARVDRLRGLGNAIVPQIAEWIGRRILESQGSVPK